TKSELTAPGALLCTTAAPGTGRSRSPSITPRESFSPVSTGVLAPTWGAGARALARGPHRQHRLDARARRGALADPLEADELDHDRIGGGTQALEAEAALRLRAGPRKRRAPRR